MLTRPLAPRSAALLQTESSLAREGFSLALFFFLIKEKPQAASTKAATRVALALNASTVVVRT